MPISTEITFAHAYRYAKVNKKDIQKVYQKITKEGKLPPLKENQLTDEYKAEDLAFEVLLKMEDGINTYEDLKR